MKSDHHGGDARHESVKIASITTQAQHSTSPTLFQIECGCMLFFILSVKSFLVEEENPQTTSSSKVKALECEFEFACPLEY
jgi:hypothetical protein